MNWTLVFCIFLGLNFLGGIVNGVVELVAKKGIPQELKADYEQIIATQKQTISNLEDVVQSQSITIFAQKSNLERGDRAYGDLVKRFSISQREHNKIFEQMNREKVMLETLLQSCRANQGAGAVVDGDVKKALRYAMTRAHPDVGGSHEKFIEYQAIYKKYGKGE